VSSGNKLNSREGRVQHWQELIFKWLPISRNRVDSVERGALSVEGYTQRRGGNSVESGALSPTALGWMKKGTAKVQHL
jgi:hypothetical protein